MWLNKMTRTIQLLELEFSRDRNADKNSTRDDDGVEKVNTQLKPQGEVLKKSVSNGRNNFKTWK